MATCGYGDEKRCKNKRKISSERSLCYPVEGSPSSLTEFPRYEMLEEKLCNALVNFGSASGKSDQPKEEKVKEHLLADWNDPIVCQLQELLSKNLHATFQAAIKRISEYGYGEEVAERVILRSGLCCGNKDPISNIVDNALIILANENGFGSSMYHIFEDMTKLVEYTMLEMVYGLMEVKPSLSAAEAMWALVISDLNLSNACELKGDVLSAFGGKEVSGLGSDLGSNYSESTVSQYKSEAEKASETIPFYPSTVYASSPSNPRGEIMLAKFPVTLDKDGRVQSVSSQPIMEGNFSVTVKSSSGHSKRDILRQRALDMGKYRGRMPKGAFKAATKRGLVLEKKQNYPPDPSGPYFKNLSSSTPAIKDTKLSKSNLPETKTLVNPQIGTPSSSKILHYYVGIPYDKSTGKYVPQDDKDEKLLALVPHMENLEKALQGWTDWLNEKVKQAARALAKDQPELKMLRQEKLEAEFIYKGKQSLEENTMKRLSEIEYALGKSLGQSQSANANISRLELENAALKKETEAVRLQALAKSEKRQQDLVKEQETQKKIQLCNPEKGLLAEELAKIKHEVAGLQKVLERAKDLYSQREVLWKQGEKEEIKLLALSRSRRKENERQDILAKEEEGKMIHKAETELQKYKDKMKELETEISKLKMESACSKISALRRGITNSGSSARTVQKRVSVFQEMKEERECVVCMMEEISVIFLPCAHQVLCENCSGLHEKQGMKDCPSCRTPIQRRFTARFAME